MTSHGRKHLPSLVGSHFSTVVLSSVGMLAGIAINATVLSSIDFAEENHPYRAVLYKMAYFLLAIGLAVALSLFVFTKYRTRDPAAMASQV